MSKTCFAGDNKNDQDSIQNFLELKFFSLSKNDQTAFDTPAAIYIVTQEDIRRSGATSIPEALKMVPGLQVAQMGGNIWAVGARGFDFQFTNKLLVMIDGRTVYTPQFSGVFWDAQDVVMEDIEKIEVIRGPGATVWGVNAVNGIINIITKSAKSTVGYGVGAYASNIGDSNISVRAGKHSDSGYYRVFAKSTHRAEATFLNGDNADDGLENKQIGFRYDNKSKNDTNISLQGDFNKSSADSFFYKFPTTNAPFYVLHDRDKDTSSGNIILKLEQNISDNYKVNTQLYYEHDAYDISNVIKRNADIVSLDVQNFWQLNDKNQLIWGVGYRGINELLVSEDNSLLTYRNPDLFLSTYNAFIQDRLEILKDKSFLTFGTKIEETYYNGLQFEPSVKLEVFPADNQTIWTSITRAVRSQSRGENTLTLRFAGTPNGFAAITNGYNLEEETLVAYESGYRVNYSNSMLVEVAAFFNDYSKLRTSEPGAASFDNIILPLSLYNNGYGQTHGVEINNKWQVNSQLKLQASYSFMEMDLHLQPGSRDVGGPAGLLANEGSFPKNQYKIASFFNITPEIEYDVMVYVIDALDVGVPAYTQLDNRLGWRPKPNVDFSIIGKNLLDDRHQEFTQALYSSPKEISRSIFCKFTYGF